MFSQYQTKFNFGFFPSTFRFLIITALRLADLIKISLQTKKLCEKNKTKCCYISVEYPLFVVIYNIYYECRNHCDKIPK